MKKYIYGIKSGNQWDTNYLSDEVLHECRAMQDWPQIMIMERKAKQAADTLCFGDHKERLLFIDAFCKGYIAANCISEEEIEASPLGEALK